MAQNGHPVRQALHLVHLVGNDDNGLAVIPHGPEHRKELVGLLGSQHGGGLIQDQDIRPTVEDLHNLHRLLLGNGHIVDLLIGVHIEAVGIADGLDLLRHLVHIQPPRLLQAQDNVLRGGEHIHQFKMLVDHADAVGEGVLRGADQGLFSVNKDLSLVREIDAGKHIHEGGLAAAVFAQQGQDLPLVNVQPHPVVGQGGAEALGNIPHLNCRLFLFQVGHSFVFECRKGQRGESSLRCPLQHSRGPKRGPGIKLF